MAEENNVVVPAKFQDIVSKIESMSVLDLSELVHLLEEKFGVSAQVAIAPVGGGAVGAAEGPEAVAEKSTWDVELTVTGEQKIAVIKIVKEVAGLGLKEAKDLVESAPKILKSGMKKEEAEALKKQIEDVGGKVTLK